MSNPITPLDHTLLEKAIYAHQSVHRLIHTPSPLLADYWVADYVGDPLIGQAQMPDKDLSRADARTFFEDSGAFITQYVGWRRSDVARHDFNLAVFATFLVVEIDPGSPSVQFLVLAPKPPESAQEGAYVGLMRSQNTDQLREAIEAEPEQTERVMQDIAHLLIALTPSPKPARKSLLQRLLRR